MPVTEINHSGPAGGAEQKLQMMNVVLAQSRFLTMGAILHMQLLLSASCIEYNINATKLQQNLKTLKMIFPGSQGAKDLYGV